MATWYDEVHAGEQRFGLLASRTLYRKQSEFQLVEVLETPAMGTVLAIDGVFMTSTADEHYYHEMIVHPALTTCRAARRVLIIGGGDGGTARRVLAHDHVERVVMVEIDACVVEACKELMPQLAAWNDPRLELVIGDGVAYVADRAREPFDVIILDGTDPRGPGEGLFGRSFYRDVAATLADGGVFALQSESPFLSRGLFLDIQSAVGEYFDRVQPYFGPAPLYAAGVWSWTYATQTADPYAIDHARAAAIEPGCKYYNRAIHRAAFAVPNDLREHLDR